LLVLFTEKRKQELCDCLPSLSCGTFSTSKLIEAGAFLGMLDFDESLFSSLIVFPFQQYPEPWTKLVLHTDFFE